jgi:hypothetical protein
MTFNREKNLFFAKKESLDRANFLRIPATFESFQVICIEGHKILPNIEELFGNEKAVNRALNIKFNVFRTFSKVT